MARRPMLRSGPADAVGAEAHREEAFAAAGRVSRAGGELADRQQLLPEPFDTLAACTVGNDCMVAFEGRQYSVPFHHAGQRVELRGVNREVQVLSGLRVIATHARATAARIVLDPAHFEGPATDTHLPPPPLGGMGRILADLDTIPVQARPADLYGAIAERLAR